MDATFEARLTSHRNFVLIQLESQFCGCWSEQPCRTCDTQVVRNTAADVICDYRGVSMTIRALADTLRAEATRGRHACVPEDGEYAYAAYIVSVAKQLGTIAGEALRVYTGYQEEDLSILRDQAMDAMGDAYASLNDMAYHAS